MRLTNAQRGQILRLHREGLTQVMIAKHVGCSQPTVSTTLRDLEDTTVAAKALARAESYAVVKASLKQAKAGKAQHAKLMLQTAEVIGQDCSTVEAVQVIVNMPGDAGTSRPRLGPEALPALPHVGLRCLRSRPYAAPGSPRPGTGCP